MRIVFDVDDTISVHENRDYESPSSAGECVTLFPS